MNKRLVILDFDRTIFSDKFYLAFLNALRNARLLTQEDVNEIMAKVGDQVLDIFAQLNLYNVDRHQAISVAHKKVVKSYIYSDAQIVFHRARHDKVVIITSSASPAPSALDYQRFKIAMNPSLRPYDKIVISGNKGEYIKDHLVTDEEFIGLTDFKGKWFTELHLIDDRIEPLLPLVGIEHVTLWHIQRPGAKYERDQDYDGIRHISSLKEVKFS